MDRSGAVIIPPSNSFNKLAQVVELSLRRARGYRLAD